MTTYSLLDRLPKVEHYPSMVVPNLCIRFSILEQVKQNLSLFYFIQVKDQERPEDIAYRVYGTQELYWLILMVNNIIDPFTEWVMSDTELLTYIKDKYGVQNVYAIHHYETTEFSPLGQGVWVNSTEPFSVAVSNFSYESELNEQKRKIKLLDPRFVPQVLAEIQKELNTLDVNR